MKKKLYVNIGTSKDLYGAYSENDEGIFAAGNTIQECKDDVYEAIRLIKEEMPEDQIPEILKGEFTIVWKYDIQSMLKRFQGELSYAGLERITGIKQKQLWNYANGVSKPRAKALKKIEEGLHAFGRELLSINL